MEETKHIRNTSVAVMIKPNPNPDIFTILWCKEEIECIVKRMWAAWRTLFNLGVVVQRQRPRSLVYYPQQSSQRTLYGSMVMFLMDLILFVGTNRCCMDHPQTDRHGSIFFCEGSGRLWGLMGGHWLVSRGMNLVRIHGHGGMGIAKI
jgi:hypothetical protein